MLKGPLRFLLMGVAWLSLGLGFAGMFMPILPTTPFVLLSAAIFLRTSESLHAWLISHKKFGPYIDDYLQGRGLTKGTKTIAILTLWGSVLFSTWRFVEFMPARVAMILVAAAVTAYLLQLPTCPVHSEEELEALAREAPDGENIGTDTE